MNLTRLVTKSAFAFRCSAVRLAELNPNLYFWTFTWAEANLPLEVYRTTWNRFTTALSRRVKEGFAGLRVWERHPGGHGLHVHMLCNHRLEVLTVRHLLARAGMGIVCDVREAVPSDAEYVSKYMTKRGRIRGVKQWAALGNWQHTKVKDIEVDSDDIRFLRQLSQLPEVRALPQSRRWVEVRRLHLLLDVDWSSKSAGKELTKLSRANRAKKDDPSVSITTIWRDGTVEREAP